MSQFNDSGLKSFTTAEAITQYARVKINSSGLLLEADADDKGIGTAQIAAASGEVCTVRLWTKQGTHKMVAAGGFSLNDVVYAADEGLIDDALTGGVAVGRALEAATAANDVVEVLPIFGEGTGLLAAAIADSASITNTTTETAFSTCSKTLDGGEFQIGDVIEVLFRGHCVATNGSDTLNLKLYLGTEEICATGAVDVANSDVGCIHAFITIRTLGASGTLSATAFTALGVAGTAAMLPRRKDQATEDMSGDVAVAVKATWGAANAGNDVIAEDFIVMKHRQ